MQHIGICEDDMRGIADAGPLRTRCVAVVSVALNAWTGELSEFAELILRKSFCWVQIKSPRRGFSKAALKDRKVVAEGFSTARAGSDQDVMPGVG